MFLAFCHFEVKYSEPQGADRPKDKENATLEGGNIVATEEKKVIFFQMYIAGNILLGKEYTTIQGQYCSFIILTSLNTALLLY